MTNTLGATQIMQVAIVTRDLETTKARWAAFLRVDPPPTIGAGEYAKTGTVYHGAPAPDASCIMAFFDIAPGVQLELIQPNGVASAWQDYLDEHGEGVHHLAFGVTDTSARLAEAQAQFGWEMLQRGKYGDASGEYAYLDAHRDLKVVLETLESF